jgi:hypothetical protein
VFARSFAPKLDARFRTAAELSEAFESLVDPADVEAATGPALGRPPSSRRLLVAPRAAAPDGGDHRYTPGEMAINGGEPGSDPVGVAVGGPTVFARKKRSSGLLVMAGAAVATVGIVVLALTAFGSRGAPTSKSPPVESTATPATSEQGDPGGQANVPPPESKPAQPNPVLSAPAATAKAPASRPVAGRIHSPPTPAPHPQPVAAPPPPAPPPVATPVAAPPAAAPQPPAVRKPPDRGEVF